MDILSNLCGACNIKKEKLLNIHDIQESSKLIKSMLEYCLQTTLTKESKYPNCICYDCVKQLQISYRFIRRFHLSRREFEESYNSLHIHYSEIDGHIFKDSVTKTTCDEIKCPTDTSENSETMNNPQIASSIKNMPLKAGNSFKYISECAVDIEKSSVICSVCNKTFFTNKALSLHTKLSHKQKISNI